VRSLVLALVSALSMTSAACGGGGSAPMCTRPELGDGPGACRAARALLYCATGDGLACGCVTDAQSCPECPSSGRVACQNACASREYAVECGAAVADAGPVVIYDDPPQGCQLIASSCGARAAYCCPCRE
jgi:hypothetical protein